MVRGVAGPTGVVGLKAFAPAIKEWELKHAPTRFLPRMEITVMETVQKMNQALVSPLSNSRFIWLSSPLVYED